MKWLRKLTLVLILLPMFVILSVFTLLQMSASMLFGSGRRGWRIAVAYDQLGNTSIGGHEDETFSSRCWNMRGIPRYDKTRAIVDWIFLKLADEKDHCKNAYKKEQISCIDRFGK